FSSRRRHTRSKRDWSSDVCSSDLSPNDQLGALAKTHHHQASAAKYTPGGCVRLFLWDPAFECTAAPLQLGQSFCHTALPRIPNRYPNIHLHSVNLSRKEPFSVSNPVH